jgi:hypothetical protein
MTDNNAMKNSNSHLVKRSLGQYFTKGNPFLYTAFSDWLSAIPITLYTQFLEPFAGVGDIPDTIDSMGINLQWACYDKDAECVQLANSKGYKSIQQDTLMQFPTGYPVVITNPPYLAKNSASRRKLDYPVNQYDDVYKFAIAKILAHTDFAAVIIPESFITQGLFHNRLSAVVSIPTLLFEDTECPVCLALFVPEHMTSKDNFKLYSGDTYLGEYADLKWCNTTMAFKSEWRFNDKNGLLGLHAVDNAKENSIYFLHGDVIHPDSIKISSRAITKIGSPYLDTNNIESFIESANAHLAEYRTATCDIFMTPFKGLRKDNLYRRRLDFKTARLILDVTLSKFKRAV